MTTIDAAGGQRTVNEQSRPVMAALQISLDGYMQGANGEVDWVDGWNDGLELLSDVTRLSSEPARTRAMNSSGGRSQPTHKAAPRC